MTSGIASARTVIDAAREEGLPTVRPALEAWLQRSGIPH